MFFFELHGTKISFSFFVALSVVSIAFGQRKDNPLKIKNPPGTVYLRDSLFIDKMEVSNLGYIEYLYHIRKDSSKEFHLSQFPINIYSRYNYQPKDSLDSVRHQYLYVAGYRYYPAVGVSYQQAKNYCYWRSAFINHRIKGKDTWHHYARSRKYDIKFTYRLPSVEEWEYAAAGGLNPDSFPYGMVRPRLDDEAYSFPIKDDPEYWAKRCLDTLQLNYGEEDMIHRVEFNVKEDFYFGLNELISCDLLKYSGVVNVDRYPENNYGIQNLIGNVAEMTLIDGIAKGGAFSHSLYDFNLGTDFIYENPANWLGFRCVCEVEIKKRKKR